MALEDYYNTPEITQAVQGVDTAMTNVANYSSQASLLPQKLKQAIQEKLDYNKDLIEQRNKAQSQYYQAPSAARAKYADPSSENYIFNPIQAEKLVDMEKAIAYEPYANLTDILAQRQGDISSMVQAGTAAFQSQVTAAEGAAARSQEKLDTLLKLAQLKVNAADSDEKNAISRAELALKKNSGSDYKDYLAMYNALKPTASQETQGNNAKSGLSEVEKMKNILNDEESADAVLQWDQTGFLGRLLAGGNLRGKVQQYQDSAKNAYDIITRTRTGAALNLDEQTFYKEFIPSYFDTKETRKLKLKRLEDIYRADVELGKDPRELLLPAASQLGIDPSMLGITNDNDPLGILK